MLHRWDSRIEDLNLILNRLREKTRGRKPKHKLVDYVALIVLKEASRKTLRGAELNLSELICNERVDHSVIAYLENQEEFIVYLVFFSLSPQQAVGYND